MTAPKKKAKVTVVPVTKTTVKTSSTVAPKAKLPGPLFKATALPSFKKEKKPEVIPAGPGSDLDPFQAALNALGPTAGGSSKPVMKTDGAVLVPVPSSLVRGGGKDKKIKKRVSFASEEKLVMIKIIERAVYDDFDSEGVRGFFFLSVSLMKSHVVRSGTNDLRGFCCSSFFYD